MITTQQLAEKYPNVGEATLEAAIAKAEADSSFDVDQHLSDIEQKQIDRLAVVWKYEADVAKKLGKEEAIVWTHLGAKGNYGSAFLQHSFLHIGLHWDFEKALTETEKLATGILKDSAEAMAVVVAFDELSETVIRVNEVGKQEMLPFVKERGLDVDQWAAEFEAHAPFGSEAGLWDEIRKKPAYREAFGAYAIATENLTRAYEVWVNDKTPQAKEPLHAALSIGIYDAQTSQEVDSLIQSAGYGPSRKYWQNNLLSDKRICEMPGATHHIEILRRRDSLSEPTAWEAIERLTDSQNSDFALAFFYVVSLLAPPMSEANPRAIIGGWIDINDVMQKIGWAAEKPRGARLEELRKQIFDFLVYGEEAIVVGKRSIAYKDKITDKEISTQIESAAWRITDVRRPDQETLFAEGKPAPVAARVVISEQWEPLFRSPSLSQYFPLGELIGAIPPHQVAGDWARLIGLNLMRQWRIKSKEALRGEGAVTRRELLTHYIPKTKTLEGLLESKNPKRAVEYYCDAVKILAESNLIEAKGDAAKDVTPAKALEHLTGYGQAARFFDEPYSLAFSNQVAPVIQRIAAGVYEKKPRDMTTGARKRRGRPKLAK